MIAARKPGFSKGRSGNPNGRPKGTVSPLKKQLLELTKLAAKDIAVAYKILWDDFQNGDASEKQLAKQIYFKELVSIPTKWLDQTIVIPQEDEVNRLEAITKALPQFEELTHDEVMNEAKTLKTIELESQKKESESIFTVMSDEQIKLVYDTYQLAKNGKEQSIKEKTLDKGSIC